MARSSNPSIGFGSKVYHSPDGTTFTALPGVREIDFSPHNGAHVDSTHMGSASQTTECIPGVADSGMLSVSGVYGPGASSWQTFVGYANSLKSYRVELTGPSETFTAQGILEEVPMNVKFDSLNEYSASIKISGVWTGAAV